MTKEKLGILLMGHGGIPSDCPDQYVSKLKRLESQRRKNNTPLTMEELELDKIIREWPRQKKRILIRPDSKPSLKGYNVSLKDWTWKSLTMNFFPPQ